jgi:hypothetical protein
MSSPCSNYDKEKVLTPMQEFILHLTKDFGYKSLDDSFWLDKEQKQIEKAYDEGVEDRGYIGNGKDFFSRTFNK